MVLESRWVEDVEESEARMWRIFYQARFLRIKVNILAAFLKIFRVKPQLGVESDANSRILSPFPQKSEFCMKKTH